MDFLDKQTPVPGPVEDVVPELAGLMAEWARRDESRLAYMFDLNNALSRLDVRRAAASASVVNVTMAGVPGHFTASPGSGRVAYVPGGHP